MKRKSLRRAMIASSFTILVMTLMLVSTSLAWFNLVIENEGARIQAGNLQVEFLAADDAAFTANRLDLTDTSLPVFAFDANAQPGDVVTRYLKVRNAGSIDLAYEVLFQVVEDELGGAVIVEVDQLEPVVTSNVYTGLSIDGQKLANQLGGMVHDDTDIYRVTIRFNETAGMEFQNKEYALDLLMVAWQADFDQSRPIFVSTIEQLQAADPVRGQSVVLTQSIIAPGENVEFNELINLNLGSNTLTLNNLKIESTDIGFARLENGYLYVDTLTINTPNAEVTQTFDFVVNAQNTNITTSGNSFLLFGNISSTNMTLSGNTRLVTEASSMLIVVKLTIDEAPEQNITVVVRPQAIVVIQDTTGGNEEELFVVEEDAVRANRLVVPGGSIQDALDAAIPGDVILVSPGTYVGALEIMKDGITLRSSHGAEQTIIDANGSTNGIAIGTFNKTGTHPTNVTVDGFTVSGWQERGIAQRNGTGTVHILKNIVEPPVTGTNNRGAIIISGGTGSTIIGNKASIPSFGDANWSSGVIVLFGSIDALIENNELIIVGGAAEIGVAIAGYGMWENLDPAWVSASGNVIRNNTIIGVQNGISLEGNVTNTIIDDNEIEALTTGIREISKSTQQDVFFIGVPASNEVINNFIDAPVGIFVQEEVTFTQAQGTYLPISPVENTFEGVSEESIFVSDGSGLLDLPLVKANNTFLVDVVVNEREILPVTGVLQNINAATDPLNMNDVILGYAEALGLSQETIDQFNAMPLDQGRHQAIGGALFWTKEFEPFTSLEYVSELFEFVVNKEHEKFLWINAVRFASTKEALEDSIREHVPTLNDIRQGLIEAGVEGLVGSNYTTTLADLSLLIEEELDFAVTLVAEELFNTLGRAEFFGVVHIANALRDILDGLAVINIDNSTSYATVTAAMTAAQDGDTLILLGIFEPFAINKPITIKGGTVIAGNIPGDAGNGGINISTDGLVILDNVTIINPNEVTGSRGILVSGSRNPDLRVVNSFISGHVQGIYFNNGKATVTGTTFENLVRGIVLESGDKVTIGTIEGNDFSGISETQRAISYGTNYVPTGFATKQDYAVWLIENNTFNSESSNAAKVAGAGIVWE